MYEWVRERWMNGYGAILVPQFIDHQTAYWISQQSVIRINREWPWEREQTTAMVKEGPKSIVKWRGDGLS